MSLKYRITLLSFVLGTSFLSAQKKVDHQGLYWIRYYNQLSLGPRWVLHNELDDRRFFKFNRQQHLIVHSRLHYKLSKTMDLGFGFTYSLQSPQDPETGSVLVVPEKRIVQQIDFSTPLNNRFIVVHRLRVDDRFIRKNNGQVLLPGYEFNFRFRYRLMINYFLTPKLAPHPAVLKLSNETMINAGKHILYNTFDQNRLSFSMEYQFTPAISTELGYMHWYQQRSSGYQFYSRDILRFTFHHRISLNKSI